MSFNPHYETVNQSQSAMLHNVEKSRAQRQRSKYIVIGSVVGILALIAIGVGVGVGVSKHNSSSSSSSTTSGDPSSFAKNPNLHKSLYGIAYTPDGSIMPDCGAELDQVIKDVQLMSQLTTRVRLYGSDCNQSAIVLEAIKQTKVDLQVYLGNYPTVDDDSVFTRQNDAIKQALQTYGSDHVAGITVGNEVILNAVTASSETDPNGSAGNAAGAKLVEYIADTRSMLKELNMDIPVGNSDAGSFFNDKVLEAVDYGLSNVHPWFAKTSIDDAAAWTWNFFQETNVEPASKLSNAPKMYIAETGWPTASVDTATKTNGASDASVANLQIFLDTFVCQANNNGTGYFFFEFKDEKWKEDKYGGVEGSWGLTNGQRELKDITIPNC
ncbi:glycoside hydrolase family 17 protein [Cylindrobasidium torrendii FP15055 ss-10]|uniref:glucan endo-1,3-beta-D-glucosidase n=1 Tax=Cylindrobasidium torrendii FP15055 ss-10 TaxID=1314674 RepID=A0A0D7BHS6_9AGAR|nr:glycoside hydrolase family 17 protein [Cylindrobasidium torrendii FP15055 ss-10]